ncbi:T9SS type A sorting domain-containing protein, partial [Winogradskyella bathintestinalis]
LAAETVDVYLNNNLLIDDFSFRTASPFIDAPAGTQLSIEIAPGNSTSSADAIYEITPTLVADETYILVADGIVSASGYTNPSSFSIEVFATARETANTTGNTDILVHHGASDAPMVDVNEATGPAVLVNDISFPEFSDYLELPTADYTINVSTADGATVVEEYSAPLSTLGLDDLAITVLASGFLDPSMNSNGPAFGLWVALPTGGALVELPTTSLSVNGLKTEDFRIYPNPAENIINISSMEAIDTKANLYDLSGRLVITTALENTNNTINVSQLKSGIYVLELSNKKGKISTKISVK